VKKDVFRSFIRLNEAKAFLGVEPFDRPACHVRSFISPCAKGRCRRRDIAGGSNARQEGRVGLSSVRARRGCDL
jgi:hypothetical protein